MAFTMSQETVGPTPLVADIKVEKYVKLLEAVDLNIDPLVLIRSSLSRFHQLIDSFSIQQKDVCKSVRKRGRNIVCALKSRRDSIEELLDLQKKVEEKRLERDKERRRTEELLAIKGAYETELLMLEIDIFLESQGLIQLN